MMWPLRSLNPTIPQKDSPAAFAYKRSYYYHPGVDLYCAEGQEVVAIEDGIVVNVEVFTGPTAEPPSPWWNPTHSIMIEGSSGVLGYCELEPMHYIARGFSIKEGDVVGKIIPVLKRDKGNGTTMLHLEHYLSGTREHMTWHHNELQPINMLDPEIILSKIVTNNVI